MSNMECALKMQIAHGARAHICNNCLEIHLLSVSLESKTNTIFNITLHMTTAKKRIGIIIFKIFILGGISLDIRSEITFKGSAGASLYNSISDPIWNGIPP